MLQYEACGNIPTTETRTNRKLTSTGSLTGCVWRDEDIKDINSVLSILIQTVTCSLFKKLSWHVHHRSNAKVNGALASCNASCVHSDKCENILYHHTNAIKYLMERRLAHKGTCGDNLIFLIHMGFIDILANVFTAQLGDGFGSAWYIRRSEKSN